MKKGKFLWIVWLIDSCLWWLWRHRQGGWHFFQGRAVDSEVHPSFVFWWCCWMSLALVSEILFSQFFALRLFLHHQTSLTLFFYAEGFKKLEQDWNRRKLSVDERSECLGIMVCILHCTCTTETRNVSSVAISNVKIGIARFKVSLSWSAFVWFAAAITSS